MASFRLWHCQGARSFRCLWTITELGLPKSSYQLITMPFPPRMTVGKKYLKRNVLGTIPFFEDLSNGAELTESCKSRERIVQPAVCKRWSANDVNRLNVLHAAECRHCPCYEGAIPQYITNKYRPHSSLAVVPTEDGYGDYLNWIAHADATLTFPQTVVLRYTLQEPGRADNAAIDYGKWFIARLRRLDNNLADGRFVYRRTVPPHCTVPPTAPSRAT